MAADLLRGLAVASGVAGAVTGGGPLSTQDNGALYELTCWQAGQPVIQERGIASLPEGAGGIPIRKADGSTLLLIDASATSGLCLLRRPGP